MRTRSVSNAQVLDSASAIKTMNRIHRDNSIGINTVGAANTGGPSTAIFSLIAGSALCAVGTAAVVTAVGSAPISGPLAAAGGVAVGYGVSKLPS